MSASADTESARIFEAHRHRLVGLAYRMLGSRAEAEDAVQDAYLRWHAADRDAVKEPRHFLSTVVTRLCLDRMKSAQARREVYVGPWLPEPVVDEAFDADTQSDFAHDLSMALMLTLERLSPLERAAFLLHDVFDLDYAEVSRALDRNEAACRQLAARARDHIHSERPRFPASQEEGQRLALAFRKAADMGDVQTLMAMLAKDAILYSDGGGKKAAALNPITGADKIMRFFEGIARKNAALAQTQVRPATINGMAGFVTRETDGTLDTMAFETYDNQIVAIYLVRNPDKLRHVTF
jgi:RNA polymerase sigma-70 factor (ECF subfamily)